jgi:lysyl-tRNA synthetase class 2
LRAFLDKEGFLEVETPLMVPCVDPSPHLTSFRLRYEDLQGQQQPFFLHTSPEFAMKRMVAAGYPRLYQLCKFFRNGEISPLHNPEFTGLEWYATGFDYEEIMRVTEAMCQALWPSGELTWQGQTFSLRSPWKRMTVHESLEHYAGLSLSPDLPYEELEAACREKGLPLDGQDLWDDLFFKLFLTYVEPHLGMDGPLFLYDYPAPLAALSRNKPGAPHLAERVELYIGGLELANGYSELTDPVEQRRRWEEEVEMRQGQGETEPFQLDPGLLNALEWGMPDCTGVAVGIDRLMMLYCDAPTLQDVLAFPLTPPLPDKAPGTF